MNDPPDGDVLSLNADSLTLTAECNHVLYKPCIVININKPQKLKNYILGPTNKLYLFVFIVCRPHPHKTYHHLGFFDKLKSLYPYFCDDGRNQTFC